MKCDIQRARDGLTVTSTFKYKNPVNNLSQTLKGAKKIIIIYISLFTSGQCDLFLFIPN